MCAPSWFCVVLIVVFDTSFRQNDHFSIAFWQCPGVFFCGGSEKTIQCCQENFLKLQNAVEFRKSKSFQHGTFSLVKPSDFVYHYYCFKKVATFNTKYRAEFDYFCRKKTVSIPYESGKKFGCSQYSVMPNLRNRNIPKIVSFLLW